MTIYTESIERNPQRPHITVDYLCNAVALGKTYQQICTEEKLSLHQLRRIGNKVDKKLMEKLAKNGRKMGLLKSKTTFHPRLKEIKPF